MTHADRSTPTGRPIGLTLADRLQDEAAFSDLEWRRVAAPRQQRELGAAAHQIRAAWDWARYSCD